MVGWILLCGRATDGVPRSVSGEFFSRCCEALLQIAERTQIFSLLFRLPGVVPTFHPGTWVPNYRWQPCYRDAEWNAPLNAMRIGEAKNPGPVCAKGDLRICVTNIGSNMSLRKKRVDVHSPLFGIFDISQAVNTWKRWKVPCSWANRDLDQVALEQSYLLATGQHMYDREHLTELDILDSFQQWSSRVEAAVNRASQRDGPCHQGSKKPCRLRAEKKVGEPNRPKTGAKGPTIDSAGPLLGNHHFGLASP